MNILHVLSQFEVTGAEAYSVTLAREQLRRGHQTFFVSDTLSLPIDAPFVPLPVGKRDYRQRLKNVADVVRFVRTHGIHVIHAHSRAASWVSFFAARITKTPLVSTIHGRQHLHLSSRSFNIYGNNIIAVAESLRKHLTLELGLKPEDVIVVPNGFDLPRGKTVSRRLKRKLLKVPEKRKVVLFVGRLTGPKGDVVRFLVSDVFPELERKTGCVLCVIGGLKVPEDIPPMIEAANRQLKKETVILKEFQKDIVPFLCAAEVVIGSGRVAVESLMAGRPTVAFGETNYHGLITEENFDEAMSTNFGDTGVAHLPDKTAVRKDLQALLRQRSFPTHPLQEITKTHFDIKSVEPRVQRVYEHARARLVSPKHIPVLMYHRVVDRSPTGSKHGIWVMAQQFRDQLTSLSGRGCTPITFFDYHRFLAGENNLPAQPVVLTFDDGYEDNYRVAFPILQEFGFKAVIYLVTDAKRRTNFWDPDEPSVPLMTPSHIREMADSGIEFGSHTVSHPRLSEISEDNVKRELRNSKDSIEQILGSEILSFAYPYGNLNASIRSIVGQEGYLYAAATNSGPMKFYEDFLEIRRTQVFPWTGAFGFWKKTQPWYSRYKNLLR